MEVSSCLLCGPLYSWTKAPCPPAKGVEKRLGLNVGLDSLFFLPEIEPLSFCRQTISSSLYQMNCYVEGASWETEFMNF
jgi:hypothetical protein